MGFESSKGYISFLMYCCIKRNYAYKLGHSRKRPSVLCWMTMIIQIKFVKKKKKASVRVKKNPEKCKIFSNEMFPPEILCQKQFEWSINCGSSQFIHRADVLMPTFVSFTLALAYRHFTHSNERARVLALGGTLIHPIT